MMIINWNETYNNWNNDTLNETYNNWNNDT